MRTKPTDDMWILNTYAAQRTMYAGGCGTFALFVLSNTHIYLFEHEWTCVLPKKAHTYNHSQPYTYTRYMNGRDRNSNTRFNASGGSALCDYCFSVLTMFCCFVIDFAQFPPLSPMQFLPISLPHSLIHSLSLAMPTPSARSPFSFSFTFSLSLSLWFSPSHPSLYSLYSLSVSVSVENNKCNGAWKTDSLDPNTVMVSFRSFFLSFSLSAPPPNLLRSFSLF